MVGGKNGGDVWDSLSSCTTDNHTSFGICHNIHQHLVGSFQTILCLRGYECWKNLEPTVDHCLHQVGDDDGQLECAAENGEVWLPPVGEGDQLTSPPLVGF